MLSKNAPENETKYEIQKKSTAARRTDENIIVPPQNIGPTGRGVGRTEKWKRIQKLIQQI
jgi:hypothetical protein